MDHEKAKENSHLKHLFLWKKLKRAGRINKEMTIYRHRAHIDAILADPEAGPLISASAK